MKQLGILIGVFAVVILLAWGGRIASTAPSEPSANSASAQSAFDFTDTAHDFGSISMKDGPVAYRFSLTNSTDHEVSIERITTSCMCTNAYLHDDSDKKGPFGMPGHGIIPRVNDAVAVAGSREVEVVFDPTAHGPAGIGPIERAVFVEDTEGGTQILTIKALVTP
ncbi:MAG: hypothetical protein COV91_06190 [Candidatus Taylorbacteria bacterium CG11_big_fil_rev_8_21_14_0_20_46_11]|uniref:DUF1573 domain-containing protein n=1 Tax=Candidatus Taylorbacteria bacterium CG11_big_fil_rev_8_21_14_0_20_46_11 TaxID=1975025 RepID=A0A2H0K9V2_9BACT|nr:MAG: hypothetical protein COV91_06190 [Candidatus Taylorbacteria bacterium CG11_big_fil_rev_8_21_14_0_20_46_11]